MFFKKTTMVGFIVACDAKPHLLTFVLEAQRSCVSIVEMGPKGGSCLTYLS
jgi:hypothetical protein